MVLSEAALTICHSNGRILFQTTMKSVAQINDAACQIGWNYPSWDVFQSNPHEIEWSYTTLSHIPPACRYRAFVTSLSPSTESHQEFSVLFETGQTSRFRNTFTHEFETTDATFFLPLNRKATVNVNWSNWTLNKQNLPGSELDVKNTTFLSRWGPCVAGNVILTKWVPKSLLRTCITSARQWVASKMAQQTSEDIQAPSIKDLWICGLIFAQKMGWTIWDLIVD